MRKEFKVLIFISHILLITIFANKNELPTTSRGTALQLHLSVVYILNSIIQSDARPNIVSNC
jgi:hypothetical protein